MTVTSLPFSSSTCRPSASAYLRPSWKMWPISMPRAVLQGARHSSGQGSPSRTSAASMVPSGVKSRPATRSSTWRAGHVGAGDPAGALDDPRVDQVADAGLVLLPQHPGADVALGQRRVLRRSRPRRRPPPRPGSSWPSSRFSSTSRSPGRPMASGSRVPSGCLSTTMTFFSVSPAVQGRSSRGNAALRWSTSVSMVGVSGVCSACAAGASSYGDRLRARRTCTASTLAA